MAKGKELAIELWSRVLQGGLTKCRPSVLTEESGNVVSNALGTNEDEALVGLVVHDLLKVLDHLVTLLRLCNNLDNLRDAVVSREIEGTNVDLDEVSQEIGSHGSDLLGPGGGPHERLSVRANLTDNLSDLGLETHVQHAISLVENQVSNTAEVGLAALDHIDQTSGGGNADLDTLSKVADLRATGNTTVDTGVSDARGATKLGDLLLNLNSQLTGGSQDQDNGSIARSQKRLGVNVDDGGKTVGKGLSGTSLGDTDNITTREGHGPALRLNSGGSRETLSLDLVHDIAGETSLVEGLDGLGHIGTVNGHLVVFSESVNLLLGAVGNSIVLLVERLLELGHRAEIWRKKLVNGLDGMMEDCYEPQFCFCRPAPRLDILSPPPPPPPPP